jgi:hypothetical protein
MSDTVGDLIKQVDACAGRASKRLASDTIKELRKSKV